MIEEFLQWLMLKQERRSSRWAEVVAANLIRGIHPNLAKAAKEFRGYKPLFIFHTPQAELAPQCR